MSNPGRRLIDCPAGRWTEIVWVSFFWGAYNVDIGGPHARWQMITTDPPYYMSGDFTRAARIPVYGSLYGRLELNPDVDVRAVISL